jgi:hypothetical protein
VRHGVRGGCRCGIAAKTHLGVFQTFHDLSRRGEAILRILLEGALGDAPHVGGHFFGHSRGLRFGREDLRDH